MWPWWPLPLWSQIAQHPQVLAMSQGMVGRMARESPWALLNSAGSPSPAKESTKYLKSEISSFCFWITTQGLLLACLGNNMGSHGSKPSELQCKMKLNLFSLCCSFLSLCFTLHLPPSLFFIFGPHLEALTAYSKLSAQRSILAVLGVNVGCQDGTQPHIWQMP